MTAHRDILNWLADIESHQNGDSYTLMRCQKSPASKQHKLDASSRPISPPETLSSFQVVDGAPVANNSKISSPSTNTHTGALKRCPGLMSDLAVPTPKRSRRDLDGEGDEYQDRNENRDAVEDDEIETPRVANRYRRNFSAKSSSVVTASTTPSLRSRSSRKSDQTGSGSRSPTERIAAMELQPDGVETRAFSMTDPRLPETLANLLDEMELCHRGFAVVSRDLQADINARSPTDRSFSLFTDLTYADPGSRNKLSPTPSVSDVAWILAEAREYQETMQSEAGWNTSVHFPLLHKAIYGTRRHPRLVGVMTCPTASIIKEYLPRGASPKMIDFCLFLDPTHAHGGYVTETAIGDLRLLLPSNVINHTDFPPLRNWPIALSVETKRRGGSQQDAHLQMAIWCTAQWKFLSDLVKQTDGTLDGLHFLPAVLVNGNEWFFAASTREDQKTVLWVKRMFGSTTTALGTYSIFWGLQRLAR